MTDSDIYGPDPDQPGEELDESVGSEYPPDRPPGLDDDGGPEREVWEADQAEEVDQPEVDEEVELAGDADVEVVDDEPELVGAEVVDDDVGPLDPEDEFTGDETTRDYATERQARPAEEVALHVEDDDDVV